MPVNSSLLLTDEACICMFLLCYTSIVVYTLLQYNPEVQTKRLSYYIGRLFIQTNFFGWGYPIYIIS